MHSTHEEMESQKEVEILGEEGIIKGSSVEDKMKGKGIRSKEERLEGERGHEKER